MSIRKAFATVALAGTVAATVGVVRRRKRA